MDKIPLFLGRGGGLVHQSPRAEGVCKETADGCDPIPVQTGMATGRYAYSATSASVQVCFHGNKSGFYPDLPQMSTSSLE